MKHVSHMRLEKNNIIFEYQNIVSLSKKNHVINLICKCRTLVTWCKYNMRLCMNNMINESNF